RARLARIGRIALARRAAAGVLRRGPIGADRLLVCRGAGPAELARGRALVRNGVTRAGRRIREVRADTQGAVDGLAVVLVHDAQRVAEARDRIIRVQVAGGDIGRRAAGDDVLAPAADVLIEADALIERDLDEVARVDPLGAGRGDVRELAVIV